MQLVPDFIGAPEEIRTPDPQIRSLVLSGLITAGDRTWIKIGEMGERSTACSDQVFGFIGAP
jgi:hypothetical protein